MATVTGMTAERIETELDDLLVDAVFDPTTGLATATTRGGEVKSIGQAPTLDQIMNQVYPVGCIHMSSSGVNPSVTLGIGTWVAWGSGRVPVGVDAAQTEFSTVEKTGGEKTHTLTAAEMPSHTHTGPSHTHAIDHDHAAFDLPAGGSHTHTYARRLAVGTSGGAAYGNTAVAADGTSDPSTHTHTVEIPAYTGNSGAGGTGATGSAGSGTAHNNLQPYVTCFMWKRTA